MADTSKLENRLSVDLPITGGSVLVRTDRKILPFLPALRGIPQWSLDKVAEALAVIVLEPSLSLTDWLSCVGNLPVGDLKHLCAELDWRMIGPPPRDKMRAATLRAVVEGSRGS